MGKNKPLKPPGKGAASQKRSSDSSSLSTLAIVGACVVGGVAFGLSTFVAMGGSAKDAEALVSKALNGNLNLRDVGVGQLSEREALQQGRVPKSFKRQACTDSRLCAKKSITAEQCEADEGLRKQCCRSCHELACVDLDEQCFDWSLADQCIDNAEFMKKNCCASCSPDPDDPCSTDPSSRPDVYKGDFTRAFERIIRDYPQYNITVHSRDPWLITLDNLLTDDECEGIKEAVGGKHGEYIKPSTTAKPVRQPNGQVILTDVPDQIRTSHNAWCQHRSCYDHPVHEAVIQRIMSIVDLPPNNAEHMQLLKYEPGAYYRLHHDWIPEQLDAACGPRAYTFFLYLSDVEEGGGTKFPYIDKIVMPKKGSAVLWPHGLDSDPRVKDDRTHHEAMPVIKGVKWAANYWIHGRDFKLAMASGCDGRQGQPKRSRMMRKGGAEARLKEDAVQRARHS